MSGEELRATLAAALDGVLRVADELIAAGWGRAALAAPSTPEPSGPASHCRGCEADADLARRAHRAAPSTEPALDVERLARATAEVSGWAHAMGEPAADYHRDWAEKVAVEYARLAESQR